MERQVTRAAARVVGLDADPARVVADPYPTRGSGHHIRGSERCAVGAAAHALGEADRVQPEPTAVCSKVVALPRIGVPLAATAAENFAAGAPAGPARPAAPRWPLIARRA